MERTKLGKIVARRLIELDMTQRDLAESMGISQVAVSRWLRGEREPQLYNVVNMLKTLGLVDIKVKDLL